MTPDLKKERDWELLGYWDPESDPSQDYALWLDDRGCLMLSNTQDQQERIELATREEATELIERLRRARDDVWPEDRT